METNNQNSNPDATLPDENNNVEVNTPSAGTGVDTDGDGNANKVTKAGDTLPVIATDDELSAAPGTGIDQDGDGNADVVIDSKGNEKPAHVDHEDDYKNKVKLSYNIADAVSKKEANKLVKDSMINTHYKDIMLKQIKGGQLYPPYNDAFKRIKAASDGGSIYRPGSDGL